MKKLKLFSIISFAAFILCVLSLAFYSNKSNADVVELPIFLAIPTLISLICVAVSAVISLIFAVRDVLKITKPFALIKRLLIQSVIMFFGLWGISALFFNDESWQDCILLAIIFPPVLLVADFLWSTKKK